ncbi:hypothetical protein [Agromyces albus]|uniref:hypothetical protein n=1 Tax=Agromyces albus TaxID=205332 RepID=UPI002782EB6D|nr:hypothetical protein [Agromyces albus]MDQ0577195.1 hypothetical protein [Agromyces albus]
MTPDRRARKQAKPKKSVGVPPAPTIRSSDDAHDVVFFQRHPADDPRRPAPGYAQLRSWPFGVRSQAMAVLAAVAAAPPKRFSGGGYWEAMHGEMTGWHEIRVDGPGRTHHRLFCLLDYEAIGKEKPLLVVIDGRVKPFMTELASDDYAEVRMLGKEYWSRNPRSLYERRSS